MKVSVKIALLIGLSVVIAAFGFVIMGHRAAAAERKPQYWYDPMHPNQHFDKPGKSPFMEMELIPKYAESGPDEASIKIDPTIVQNLGVRLATVERGPFLRPVEAIGSIIFNERNIAVVQARTSGFVTRVYARAPESAGGKHALEMNLFTLRKMAAGGMHDHLGGGFHRYTVDGRWVVPHFEKMLYDNALLARLGVHLWQATGDTEVRRVAPEGTGWRVEIAGGPSRLYRGVVIANGHHWDPRWPNFPGTFAGQTLHSAEYKTPEKYQGYTSNIALFGGIAGQIKLLADEMKR